MQPAADTERNRWIAKLAGCTPLAVELNYVRASLNGALGRHRQAQKIAAKGWASDADRARPASTRRHVIEAVAKVREIEQQIVAKYGHALPQQPAEVCADLRVLSAVQMKEAA